jgi:heme/copper-type cytochrome/quinol oxidase subunit 2
MNGSAPIQKPLPMNVAVIMMLILRQIIAIGVIVVMTMLHIRYGRSSGHSTSGELVLRAIPVFGMIQRALTDMAITLLARWFRILIMG